MSSGAQGHTRPPIIGKKCKERRMWAATSVEDPCSVGPEGRIWQTAKTKNVTWGVTTDFCVICISKSLCKLKKVIYWEFHAHYLFVSVVPPMWWCHEITCQLDFIFKLVNVKKICCQFPITECPLDIKTCISLDTKLWSLPVALRWVDTNGSQPQPRCLKTLGLKKKKDQKSLYQGHGLGSSLLLLLLLSLRTSSSAPYNCITDTYWVFPPVVISKILLVCTSLVTESNTQKTAVRVK